MCPYLQIQWKRFNSQNGSLFHNETETMHHIKHEYDDSSSNGFQKYVKYIPMCPNSCCPQKYEDVYIMYSALPFIKQKVEQHGTDHSFIVFPSFILYSALPFI